MLLGIYLSHIIHLQIYNLNTSNIYNIYICIMKLTVYDETHSMKKASNLQFSLYNIITFKTYSYMYKNTT